MSVFSEAATSFVEHLDAAVEAHLGWTRRILRCAVVRESPGEDVMAEDAHCRCTFGRWIMSARPTFEAMDPVATRQLFDEHRRMHDAVRKMCGNFVAHAPVEIADLEVFETSQSALIDRMAQFKTSYLGASARIDELTGLPLRYGLENEVGRLRRNACDTGLLVNVAMLDIDRFKSINDRFGHAVGDRALQHVANILRATQPEKGMAFRFGGEEFLLVFASTSPQAGSAAVERILDALRRTPLTIAGSIRLDVRASAGLATEFENEPLSRMIERADAALYRAKADGRDTIRLAA